MVEIVIQISSLLVLTGQIKIDFILVHPQAAHRILWQVSDSYGAFESHQDHQFGRCVCAWLDTDGGGIQQVNNK
jgi:hypothetical protein